MPGSPPISTREPVTTPPPTPPPPPPPPPPPRLAPDLADRLGRGRREPRPRRRAARGRHPLLHQLDVGPHPGAVGTGARLRRREPALLAAVGGAGARHQRPPAPADSTARPESIVERMSVRRRKLRRAPSRNCTRFS